MPVIRMPLIVAKDMAAALLPHASRDKWERYRPLGQVAVGITESQFAFAADRYTLGRFDLTNVATEWPDKPMFIPRDLLSVIGTLGSATLYDDLTKYEVVIEVGENPTAEKRNGHKWEAALKVRLLDGDTPPQLHYLRVFRAMDQTLQHVPMNRLFEEWVTGDEVNPRTLIDPTHLGKFAGFARRDRRPMRITLPANPPLGEGKHSPLLIEIGQRFKGLLMPFSARGIYEFGPDLAADNRARIEASKHADPDPTDVPEQPAPGTPKGN